MLTLTMLDEGCMWGISQRHETYISYCRFTVVMEGDPGCGKSSGAKVTLSTTGSYPHNYPTLFTDESNGDITSKQPWALFQTIKTNQVRLEKLPNGFTTLGRKRKNACKNFKMWANIFHQQPCH